MENLSEWGGANEIKKGIDIFNYFYFYFFIFIIIFDYKLNINSNEQVVVKLLSDETQFKTESENLFNLKSDHVVKLLAHYSGNETLNK